MIATNIEWDCDGINPDELGLPTEVVIPDWIMENGVGEYLCEEYGWCVYGYNVEY